MATTDLKRAHPGYRARQDRFDLLELPPQRVVAIDGEGDPNASPSYRDALATLFPLAYALKAIGRRDLGVDHVVMPLEGLWDADDLASFTTRRDKAAWRWTMLIAQPDWVDEEQLERARAEVAARGRGPASALARLAVLDEGRCVQTLHVGPYDDEGPVLAELHERVLPSLGLRPDGRHHEVYLGDARRAAPERLRTILRQPVALA
ncbi:GyrI-like domain-containing protein [Agrococcus sp. SL85]|uniref:GyrI-like domain-containing protein n=1 Tax=Agrococcus sp. SL85 TaxID=2995141 RepID=UPI00226CADC8|nr:GyrI-like domain-containing protein [Agrococcus sp. SL85]WAC66219.1 GyrI-like domain-containing protein [Agrococcus sp. SL85]